VQDEQQVAFDDRALLGLFIQKKPNKGFPKRTQRWVGIVVKSNMPEMGGQKAGKRIAGR